MWKSVSIFLMMGVVGCSVQPTTSEVAQPRFRTMTVQSSPPPSETRSTFTAQSSIFKVVEAPAGELNADTLGTEASVQVSYPNLAPKDTVGVRLTGVALRDAPIQTVSTTGVLTFKLLKAWINENRGRTVNLTYTYKVGGVGNLITSSPLSIRVVGAQGQSVFKVVEAPTGELNADTLGTEANVQVSYPNLAPKDTVGVRLTGVALRDAPIQTVSTTGVLTFKLLKAWINENRGRTVNLTYTYKVGGVGNLITSSPLSIRVVGAQGQSVFKVVEAPTGELNADTLGTEASVQVSYPNLAPKDTVGVRLTGVALRDAPIQTVSTTGVLTFKLLKAWINENRGRTVNLTYTYKVGGVGNLITSSPLSIRVVGAQGQSVFKVVEAPTGELNADTLGTEASVQVSYPNLAPKDTVGVRLTGVALRDARIQTVATTGVLTFKLLKAWINENRGRTVNLTYTYKVGGVGNLITSSPLPIKVTGVAAPGDGPRVANELNAQYATTSNTCPSNSSLGVWYCAGVLIRTVDDSTAFHAWNPSPGAVNLGGVSFSYMKTGIGMNQLQGSRTQGFVLETGQNFTANGGYPLQVLCSYPYDGGTLIRNTAGCGAASNFPSNSGPCAAQGLTTLTAWRAHFQQYPASSTNRYHHQCSFGVDRAGFELSLLSRENPSGELAAWRQNEVIIKTWPQNISNLPIKAFIYFNTASRAVGVEGAKNIQRDFLKTTGRRIPVIKVSPHAANIFIYSDADQGI